jgi:hypothetical protein
MAMVSIDLPLFFLYSLKKNPDPLQEIGTIFILKFCASQPLTEQYDYGGCAYVASFRFVPLFTLEFKKELYRSQRDFSKYSFNFTIFR